MFTKIKTALKIAGVPVVVASLCCLSPVLLVVFGLGTVGFASSLADTLYGQYKWYFRAAGLLAMLASVWWYFWHSQGVCTLDAAKRRRNEIMNTIALTLIVGVIGYIVFLYVIVEYIGVLLKLWR